jgi:hypothetical protein
MCVKMLQACSESHSRGGAPGYRDQPEQPGWAARHYGDGARAQPLVERALAITEQALGPDHPTTVMVRDNLAALDEAQAQGSPAYTQDRPADRDPAGAGHAGATTED